MPTMRQAELVNRLASVLTRTEAVNLVKGTTPKPDLMGHHLVNPNGAFNKAKNQWEWNTDAFKLESIEQVIECYDVCTRGDLIK